MVDFQPQNREELTDPTTSLNRILSVPLRGLPGLDAQWREVRSKVRDFIRSEEYSVLIDSTPVPKLLNHTLGMVRVVLMASAGKKASTTEEYIQSNSEFETRTTDRLYEKLSELKNYADGLDLDSDLDWKRPFKALVQDVDNFCEIFIEQIQSNS